MKSTVCLRRWVPSQYRGLHFSENCLGWARNIGFSSLLYARLVEMMIVDGTEISICFYLPHNSNRTSFGPISSSATRPG